MPVIKIEISTEPETKGAKVFKPTDGITVYEKLMPMLAKLHEEMAVKDLHSVMQAPELKFSSVTAYKIILLTEMIFTGKANTWEVSRRINKGIFPVTKAFETACAEIAELVNQKSSLGD